MHIVRLSFDNHPLLQQKQQCSCWWPSYCRGLFRKRHYWFFFFKIRQRYIRGATATVAGTAVSVFLPHGTDKIALKASFTISDKATVTVNNTTQISGTTANNFTNAVIYTVKAEDGSKKDYTVTLTTDISRH